MDKENFLNKLEPYVNSGLVRVVSTSKNSCILNFGEILYLLSTYDVMDNVPLGVFIPADKLIDYVKDEKLPLHYMKHCYKNIKKNSNMFYELDPNKLDYWKKWIQTTKNNFNNTDYSVEEEINRIVNGKTK